MKRAVLLLVILLVAAGPTVAPIHSQSPSPDEARLGLQSLVRRDELDPVARVELFAELAGHFKAIVTFPPETVESMPDEQYVRNVVDILFRTRTTEAKPVLRQMTGLEG